MIVIHPLTDRVVTPVTEHPRLLQCIHPVGQREPEPMRDDHPPRPDPNQNRP